MQKDNEMNEDGKNPKIVVLMSAYNAEKTLRRSVNSVLASVIPVDLYIVDDGSAKPVSVFLGEVPENVFIHRLSKNVGLPLALNAGLAAILEKDYDYVARFDADDFSYPERFQKQIDYLTSHPDVQVAGCWVRAVDDKTGKILFNLCHPEHHEDILRTMRYNSAFIHPALLFRTEVFRVLDRHYNVDYRIAQDYELMARVVRKFRTANVPQVLMDYSYLLEGSSSFKKRRRQLWNRLKVQIGNFSLADVHAWIGIIKTACLFCLPLPLVTKMKKKRILAPGNIK
ncbi:MAG: glycosyltransferase [Alphaproteobacteria bacterium]|nr:glycosyltransferase [Alphaproteobacteria bacterium]